VAGPVRGHLSSFPTLRPETRSRRHPGRRAAGRGGRDAPGMPDPAGLGIRPGAPPGQVRPARAPGLGRAPAGAARAPAEPSPPLPLDRSSSPCSGRDQRLAPRDGGTAPPLVKATLEPPTRHRDPGEDWQAGPPWADGPWHSHAAAGSGRRAEASSAAADGLRRAGRPRPPAAQRRSPPAAGGGSHRAPRRRSAADSSPRQSRRGSGGRRSHSP